MKDNSPANFGEAVEVEGSGNDMDTITEQEPNTAEFPAFAYFLVASLGTKTFRQRLYLSRAHASNKAREWTRQGVTVHRYQVRLKDFQAKRYTGAKRVKHGDK